MTQEKNENKSGPKKSNVAYQQQQMIMYLFVKSILLAQQSYKKIHDVIIVETWNSKITFIIQITLRKLRSIENIQQSMESNQTSANKKVQLPFQSFVQQKIAIKIVPTSDKTIEACKEINHIMKHINPNIFTLSHRLYKVHSLYLLAIIFINIKSFQLFVGQFSR